MNEQDFHVGEQVNIWEGAQLAATGKIMRLTTVGAYICHNKNTPDPFYEWFPYKSKRLVMVKTS